MNQKRPAAWYAWLMLPARRRRRRGSPGRLTLSASSPASSRPCAASTAVIWPPALAHASRCKAALIASMPTRRGPDAAGRVARVASRRVLGMVEPVMP